MVDLDIPLRQDILCNKVEQQLDEERKGDRDDSWLVPLGIGFKFLCGCAMPECVVK